MAAADDEPLEQTIQKHSAPHPLRLFSSWFCPFAQRVLVALEEKDAGYEYVRVEPYQPDPSKPGGYSKNPVPREEMRTRYPGFIETSPNGLVPAIEWNRDGKVERVHDSMVVVDYIDEAIEGPSLLPVGDPAARAHVQTWCKHVDEKIVPHFYRMLMKPGADEREEEKRLLIQGLEAFAAAMAPLDSGNGAYFLGDAFSRADVSLLPWWSRFHSIGAHYRDLKIPQGGSFDRLWAWGEACDKRETVARTHAAPHRLIANYSNYADGSSTSFVAKLFNGEPPAKKQKS